MQAGNRSLWQATCSVPSADRPHLPDSSYDVAVVGGGIAGIATAFHLTSYGLKVVLLEAATLLSGVTGHTTGKLTSQHAIYRQIAHRRGMDMARIYAEANEWAIKFVVEGWAAPSIECDLAIDNAFVFASNAEELEELRGEYETCKEIGLPARMAEANEVPVASFGALAFTNQVRFHPLKFLRALVTLAQERGLDVCEQCRVKSVKEEGETCQVETNHGPLRAGHVVVATNYPIHDSGWFVAKLAPYRSYAMAFRLATEVLDGMFISANYPLKSFRKQSGLEGDFLIVGGGHHRVGQDTDPEANYHSIDSFARENFDVVDEAYRWSTQDNWTVDDIPYIGLSPDRKRTYIATGFGGWGMTTGLLAGKLLCDLIHRGSSPWQELYDPSRPAWRSLGALVKENTSSVVHLVGDRVKPAEVKAVADVARGQGAVVQLNDKRAAVYRDDAGEIHALSTVCSHMGCQVAWNAAETSWDCPCHGSRFDIYGKVLHGPAVESLPPIAIVTAASEEAPERPKEDAIHR